MQPNPDWRGRNLPTLSLSKLGHATVAFSLFFWRFSKKYALNNIPSKSPSVFLGPIDCPLCGGCFSATALHLDRKSQSAIFHGFLMHSIAFSLRGERRLNFSAPIEGECWWRNSWIWYSIWMQLLNLNINCSPACSRTVLKLTHLVPSNSRSTLAAIWTEPGRFLALEWIFLAICSILVIWFGTLMILKIVLSGRQKSKNRNNYEWGTYIN